MELNIIKYEMSSDDVEFFLGAMPQFDYLDILFYKSCRWMVVGEG